MNRLLGLVKLRCLIIKNANRNMSLMDTDKGIDVMSDILYDFGHMNFFDNYEEFQEIIKKMKDDEKKVFLSMPLEQTRENYFMFDYVKPKNMVSYIEKKDGRVKCTFNKKFGLKRENYAKRNK